jgi:RNA polymerase sigma-70 factor (sigma-E family)
MSERTAVVRKDRAEPEPTPMTELYTRFVPAGMRLAFLLTGDPHQAEDLTHEAFVRCVGRFGHLRARESFHAYLRRTIVNLHTSGIRRRYVERRWLQHEGRMAAVATDSLPDVGEREDLWRALALLPPRQRAALVLRYYEDLSEQDTAATLRCSVAAVKSLVARGSEALRALVSEGDAP